MAVRVLVISCANGAVGFRYVPTTTRGVFAWVCLNDGTSIPAAENTQALTLACIQALTAKAVSIHGAYQAVAQVDL